MKTTLKIVLFILPVVFWSCSVKYSLTGASISDETKTFQVNYFQNNSTLIEPGIDRDFTNKLIDLLINQTSLDLVKSNGDLLYEGEIVEYRISPTTATANNTAAQNRLTISVKVKFENGKDESKNFEQQFSRYNDFPSDTNLVSIENTLIEQITNELAEDIFNKAVVNW